MNRTLFLMILSLFPLIGISCSRPEPAALHIGDIQVSAQDFEAAFKSSPYIYQGPQGRKAFLDTYVTKKLILAEAERLNLDKDPSFLNDIQIFWEQGLLKMILMEKNKEFASIAAVSDQEIVDVYNQQPEIFKNKPIAEVKEEIASIIHKEKQTAMMKQWIENLKDKTKITIDFQHLGIKPPQEK